MSQISLRNQPQGGFAFIAVIPLRQSAGIPRADRHESASGDLRKGNLSSRDGPGRSIDKALVEKAFLFGHSAAVTAGPVGRGGSSLH